MKKIILFSALSIALLSSSWAQNNNTNSNRPMVVRRITDVSAQGVKTITVTYANGTEKKSVATVSVPKGTDVVHQEELYDQKSEALQVKQKKLANGTVVNSAQ
jgi:hypothetical protein